VLAKLTEIGTPNRKEIPITREEFLIGRGIDCDLRLGSSEVSRHHCLLRVRGDEATVIDLGSSNGTYLNGHRVRSQAVLQSGDELRVAAFRFALELDNQDGITWYSEPGVDPSANTFKIQDVKRQLAEGGGEKERGHPPGKAGGQGGSTEKESG
jgi:pSer/pThr/pTyr-binding forkhead associated (FHA) protein